jgi:hypothetical protein
MNISSYTVMYSIFQKEKKSIISLKKYASDKICCNNKFSYLFKSIRGIQS